MPDRAALIEAMGLTIVPVKPLRDNVVLVKSQRLVLVRPDLTDQDWDAAYDQLILAACSTPPGP